MNKLSEQLLNIRGAITARNYQDLNIWCRTIVCTISKHLNDALNIREQRAAVEIIHILMAIKYQNKEEETVLFTPNYFTVFNSHEINIPANMDIIEELMVMLAEKYYIDYTEHFIFFGDYVQFNVYEVVNPIVFLSLLKLTPTLVGRTTAELMTNKIITDFYSYEDEDSFAFEILERSKGPHFKQITTVIKVSFLSKDYDETKVGFLEEMKELDVFDLNQSY